MESSVLKTRLYPIIEKYTAQEKELVLGAYSIAEKALSDIKRGNGVPFIEHPAGVAAIVANEIGLMPDAIALAVYADTAPNSVKTLPGTPRTFSFTQFV